MQAGDGRSAHAEDDIYYGAKCCVSVCLGSLVSCVTALSSFLSPPSVKASVGEASRRPQAN